MFLVTSHKESANKLINILSDNNINSIHFPIVELSKNDINTEIVVKNIANNVVLCTSPTSAMFARNVIEKLNGNIVITPGIGTATIVKSLNDKLNVKFPEYDSGIDSIINNGLLSNTRSIAIFGSNTINPKLTTFCKQNNIKVTNISLYSYNLFYKDQTSWLNSILETIPSITGIIVTSSNVANGVNYLMQFDEFKKKLSHSVFITSHHQIAEKFSNQNLNVIVLKSSTIEELLISIRKIVI